MKRKILVIASHIFILSVFARDDDMAYFTYYVNTSIQVEAEIPASIDEALVDFNPSLSEANKSALYQETLKD